MREGEGGRREGGREGGGVREGGGREGGEGREGKGREGKGREGKGREEPYNIDGGASCNLLFFSLSLFVWVALCVYGQGVIC